MATRHDDGSVTLTPQEFQCCSAFLELPANEFLAFLNAQGTQDGFSAEELAEKIVQYHRAANCRTDGLTN